MVTYQTLVERAEEAMFCARRFYSECRAQGAYIDAHVVLVGNHSTLEGLGSRLGHENLPTIQLFPI